MPTRRPRISVAPDARLALVVDDTSAYTIDIAANAVRGTIEVPEVSDVGWLGSSGVIVVAHTRVRVVDMGTRTPQVFDHTLASPMRLMATCESTALLGGEHGSLLLTCGTAGISAQPFPARGVPTVAGAGGGQFLVDIGGAIEEWDPVSRMPRRRLRRRKSTRVRALGGTDRTVWFVDHETPARIDACVLVALNQPTLHELPEPIARIAAHPRLDSLWCLGDSGRVYVVDLTGQSQPQIIAESVEDIGVGAGTAIALVVARAGHPVEVSSSATTGLRRSTIGRAPGAGARDHASWRDELIDWTRHGDVIGAPIAPAIAAIGERFELPEVLLPAIALCYGAHLCGETSVPLADIALVLGGLWDEALGRGELAAKGVVVMAESRATLSAAIHRALDELPPTVGVLIGTPGPIALHGAYVLVSTEPLAQLAARLVTRLGCAILVDGLPDEARAYGAIALTRSTSVGARDPAIVVVDDEAARARLELPSISESE